MDYNLILKPSTIFLIFPEIFLFVSTITLFVYAIFVQNSKINITKDIAYLTLAILVITIILYISSVFGNYHNMIIQDTYTVYTKIVILTLSTIVIFLSEILHHSIQEEEKNENLFTYLETALIWLDTHEETSNFHLILLLEITKFFGFYPDTSEIDFKNFEMTDGIFSPFQGMNCLNEHETHLFKKLINLKFDSNQKVFAGIERQILLKIILEYYSIHLDGFKKPKSLDVLKEVFS